MLFGFGRFINFKYIVGGSSVVGLGGGGVTLLGGASLMELEENSEVPKVNNSGSRKKTNPKKSKPVKVDVQGGEPTGILKILKLAVDDTIIELSEHQKGQLARKEQTDNEYRQMAIKTEEIGHGRVSQKYSGISLHELDLRMREIRFVLPKFRADGNFVTSDIRILKGDEHGCEISEIYLVVIGHQTGSLIPVQASKCIPRWGVFSAAPREIAGIGEHGDFNWMDFNYGTLQFYSLWRRLVGINQVIGFFLSKNLQSAGGMVDVIWKFFREPDFRNSVLASMKIDASNYSAISAIIEAGAPENRSHSVDDGSDLEKGVRQLLTNVQKALKDFCSEDSCDGFEIAKTTETGPYSKLAYMEHGQNKTGDDQAKTREIYSIDFKKDFTLGSLGAYGKSNDGKSEHPLSKFLVSLMSVELVKSKAMGMDALFGDAAPFLGINKLEIKKDEKITFHLYKRSDKMVPATMGGLGKMGTKHRNAVFGGKYMDVEQTIDLSKFHKFFASIYSQLSSYNDSSKGIANQVSTLISQGVDGVKETAKKEGISMLVHNMNSYFGGVCDNQDESKKDADCSKNAWVKFFETLLKRPVVLGSTQIEIPFASARYKTPKKYCEAQATTRKRRSTSSASSNPVWKFDCLKDFLKDYPNVDFASERDAEYTKNFAILLSESGYDYQIIKSNFSQNTINAASKTSSGGDSKFQADILNNRREYVKVFMEHNKLTDIDPDEVKFSYHTFRVEDALQAVLKGWNGGALNLVLNPAKVIVPDVLGPGAIKRDLMLIHLNFPREKGFIFESFPKFGYYSTSTHTAFVLPDFDKDKLWTGSIRI